MQEECIHWVIREEGDGALDTVAMTIMAMIVTTIGGEQVDVWDKSDFSLGVIKELVRDHTSQHLLGDFLNSRIHYG